MSFHDLYYETSQKVINKDNYLKIYNLLSDSIKSWQINKIENHQYCGISKNCFVDSLICFNKSGDKFISAKLMQQLIEGSTADDINFLLGVKIKNKWYFLKTASVFIPREMFKGHPINLPLSYQQLHEMALKNVYKGYLNEDGSINESWFAHYFEGPDWGDFHDQESLDWYLKGKRFSNKKDFFDFLYLENVKGNWLLRDTTQPILGLNGDTLRLP